MMALLEYLPEAKGRQAFMDNLYISAKFLQAIFLILGICITGVCCIGGRGIPDIVE